MGEALIARGMVMEPNSIVRKVIRLKTDIITENKVWEVPGNCLNEKGISVRIFGGGGGAATGGGGGGGWMNNAILNLQIYESIQVNIGAGGTYNNVGGSTFFGAYLSANGGGAPNSIFMGAAVCAGSGGSGGGGAIGGALFSMSNGGTGYQFGGGGASGLLELMTPSDVQMNNMYNKHAGDGGQYGGGGGSVVYKLNNGTKNTTGKIGNGGTYGGNGGSNIAAAQNGTNISGIDIPIFGNELSGYPVNGSGGGYCGGGGGYGGCGGNGDNTILLRDTTDPDPYSRAATGAGGGGGGYRSNGGNGTAPRRVRTWTTSSSGQVWYNYVYPGCGGGGGGYGGKGADGSLLANGNMVGGGGGGYGVANYGSGGGSSLNTTNNLYGVHGVCVIQYYVQEMST